MVIVTLAAVEPSSAHRQRGLALASLRARQWLHFCALPLAGVGASQLLDAGQWLRLLAGGIAAAGCLGFAYGLNAVVERGSDRSSKKNPLVADPDDREGARAAVWAAIGVGAGALGLGLWLGSTAVFATLLSLACGAAYSVGPRGKRVPGLGLALNTGIFLPLTALLIERDAIPSTWLHEVGLFTVLLIQNQLVHELADLDEDRAAGAATTAGWLGADATCRIGVGSCALIPLTSLLLGLHLAQLGVSLLLALAAAWTIHGARTDPGRARERHRWLAFVGGALLWLLARMHGA